MENYTRNNCASPTKSGHNNTENLSQISPQSEPRIMASGAGAPTSTASSTSSSSERICQFFLRGRCQRENCEFKHDPARLQAASASSSGPPPPTTATTSTVETEGAGSEAKKEVCREFAAKKTCRFKSSCRFRHEDPEEMASKTTRSDWDEESLVIRKGAGGASDLEDDEESIASGFTEVTTAGVGETPKKKDTKTAAEAAKSEGQKVSGKNELVFQLHVLSLKVIIVDSCGKSCFVLA